MIYISKDAYGQMLTHAQRKLRGDFQPPETPERKAFGLLGGHVEEDRVNVVDLVALLRNRRTDEAYRPTLDPLIDQLAVPSETPADRRGWVADATELLTAQRRWERMGVGLIGSYHTHRVPWNTDPSRDTCTELDRALSKHTGLWVFIVSMVNPARPIIRAFFEADNEHEAEVVVA
jgi:hypothetical protein